MQQPVQPVKEATMRLLQSYVHGEIVSGPLYEGSNSVIYGTVRGFHFIGDQVSVRIEQHGWAIGTVEKSDSLLKRELKRPSIVSVYLSKFVKVARDGTLTFLPNNKKTEAVVKKP